MVLVSPEILKDNLIICRTAIAVDLQGQRVFTSFPMNRLDNAGMTMDGTLGPTVQKNNAILSQLLLQFGHGAVYKRSGAPLLARAADVDHEVLQQLRALHGVEHLGVELHGPHRLLGRGKGRIGNICRRTNHFEVVGDGRDGVAMAHPHLRAFLESLEERIGEIDAFQMGAAILARVGLFHLATQRVRDELRAVADAQHGQTAHKLAEVYLERLGVVDRVGRTTQDDANDGGVVLRELVVRQNLAEGVQLAHTPSDELRGLRSEIKNDNLLLHTI